MFWSMPIDSSACSCDRCFCPSLDDTLTLLESTILVRSSVQNLVDQSEMILPVTSDASRVFPGLVHSQ